MSSVRSGTLSRVRPAKCTYLHTAVSILVVSALAVAGWAAVAVGGGASSESSESTLSQLRSASSQSVAHELEEAASAAVPPAETVVAESAVEISLPRPVVPVGPILPVATSVPPDSPMVGKFGLLCLPIMADITANRFPMSCTVSSEGGFSGEVEFSCLKLKPGVSCLFNPPSVHLAEGGSVISTMVLDMTGGQYGSHDFKVQASGGELSVTNSFFPAKVDPNGLAPGPRTFGPDDYADEPHITMACDPPPGAPMALVQGDSIDITCTVGSYLGFSDPVDAYCVSSMDGTGLQCTGSTTVTPPPNGSITVVFTLTVPTDYQPPGDGNNNVAIFASRQTVFTDPGRLDYHPTIPRLP